MVRDVYIASVGLTKVDLTGRIFQSVFELFSEAYHRALEDSPVRSFDALQLGIMDSEEFENRANLAAKVADRFGLTGIPAVRSETASSTGAAAFHEAYHKIASGQCDDVLVIAGERMKNVTTEVATAIMSKTIDPVERKFGFTMPALIALVTQAWLQERKIRGKAVADLLGRLMVRAHALGAENPLAAFYGKPELLDAYFDTTKNLPVATPLMRKDCSPICDGAAAIVLTARPQPIRVAGLGSATETSSILDRERLACLDATRAAARVAYWRAGIARPRELEGLVVECHDAFNSLLPISLTDLGLVEADEAVEALVGNARKEPTDPLEHPVTGVDGRLPVNLSGGLKARGHPVGGTGLFQIAECWLQLAGRFPNPRAQVSGARVGIAHSIGGPGNNVYVTVIERSDADRSPDTVARPQLTFRSVDGGPDRPEPEALHGARAVVEANTSIHVTSGGQPGPIHVGLVKLGGRRAFAKLDHPPHEDEAPEAVLAGQKVRLLVKDDGDQYFQIPRGRSFDLGRLIDRVRGAVARRRPPEEPSGSKEETGPPDQVD
ncbi:MAG: beta-ketoacyl synthase N-terminal-like domain-containing protein [Myxococcota bacterium]|nr:beta-ketoacyl synthase N-terminal-like domain-containing protein [Myxococcota bacterium]